MIDFRIPGFNLEYILVNRMSQGGFRMKIQGNQKKMYLLSLAFLIAAAVLACVWTFTGGNRETATETAAKIPVETTLPAPETEANDGAQTTPQPEDQQGSGKTMSTVVYYQDNYGYLVPVMCNVAYSDGIAKTTLNMMVKSSQNDMNAARLGLRTVLPENTKIDLDISGGTARIDLSREVLKMEDAAAESNMITAIVQTLTEFDTVNEVEFLVGGQKLKKLPHGTDISKKFKRGDINPETSVETMSGLEAVQLYFPCESSSVVVPVTRMVYSQPDVNTAVLELVKGPGAQCPLEGALPAGCGLIDVKVENGVAKVNFTSEFAKLVENSDGGRLALKALVLTCTQFEGINDVEIYVEGEPYDAGDDALSVPSFANVADDIVYNYIQTQSDMIFDYE